MLSSKKGDNFNDGDEGTLPDLPPIDPAFLPSRRLRNPFEEENKVNSLPTFPDTPSHNSFSQTAIKDAVSSDMPGEQLPELPKLSETIPSSINEKNKNFKTMEMEEWEPESVPEDSNKIPEIPESPMPLQQSMPRTFQSPQPKQIQSPQSQVPENKNKDIFVKIEKFRNVRKTLSDVKDKLEEIDSLLQKIRETKMREEQELSAWEKEMANSKARVQSVISDIFEKVK